MDSGSQQPTGGSDFLAFDQKANDGPKNFRNNYQYRPYNRNRNQHIRRNQHFGGRYESDAQFSPHNFSSPQQKFDNGFRNHPNYMNHFQNRRNFQPHRKFDGPNQRSEAPIQHYFHKSMLEDPWAFCHQFNGTSPPEILNDDPNPDVQNPEEESAEAENSILLNPEDSPDDT